MDTKHAFFGLPQTETPRSKERIPCLNEPFFIHHKNGLERRREAGNSSDSIAQMNAFELEERMFIKQALQAGRTGKGVDSPWFLFRVHGIWNGAPLRFIAF